MAKGRDWREARRKVNETGRCVACGRTDAYLDAAHVVPRSLGGEMNKDSVVALCRPCHSAYDAYELDLLPCLSTEEQIEAVRVLGSIERAHRRLAPAFWKKMGDKTGDPLPW